MISSVSSSSTIYSSPSTSSGTKKPQADWFTELGEASGGLKYAGVTTEYLNYLNESREARKAECAQARENLVDGLTSEQIDSLSAKYDPKHMSRGEYSSFLDDLCEFGYFSELDKPFVSGLDMTPIAYVESGGYLTEMTGVRGYSNLFPERGDVLNWVKYMASFGTWNSTSGAFEKSERASVFERIQNVLLRMK